MLINKMKNKYMMDADVNLYNAPLFHNKTITCPKLKSFRTVAITALLTFTLAGCNNVGVKVSGAIGTFKLTNNGADEIQISDNGLHIFPKSIDTGDAYDVDVVQRSDTSNGHLCRVTGGSNSDGSGIMVDGGVVVLVDCVGI